MSRFFEKNMADSMKILVISDAWHPQVNGVVRTYEYLNQALEKAGHIVKTIGPADFKRRFPMPGYAEIELVLFAYKNLSLMIEAFNPDSIHIATEGPLGWAARKYCLKNNKKFTSSYHSQFPDYFAKRVAKYFLFLYNFCHARCVNLIRKFHNSSSALLVTTQSMAEELKAWKIEAPIFLFTRGIDTSLFYVGDPTLFDDLPKPIALYVGRLAIEKNIEEFLQMEWQGSKVVVGHGPDSEMLQAKYPHVHFAGKQTGKALADHYRSADVFVFPSYTDTFGIVLIEALACGLPIAAHDVIGPRDVVTEDLLGYLDEDLTVAAQNAIQNKDRQARHNYAIENYSWEKAMSQFLEATKETLEENNV